VTKNTHFIVIFSGMLTVLLLDHGM